MSHLAHDTVWGLARGDVMGDDARAAEAHLAGCPECRVALEDVRSAQVALALLPEAPPMPEALARRVGARLADAADAQAARRFGPWWRHLLAPRLVLAVAAAALALIAASLLTGAPGQPPALLQSPITAAPPTAPPAPTPVALSATVTSARKATAAGAAATKAQALGEGATLATERGGSLWVRLPDGSRAGLTAASQVRLVTLTARTLTLELAHGSLALVVPHREDRLLVVRAGEVQVKDLGTRFLVSQTPERTLVAVEEGEVEVTTPAGVRVVRAGRAVTWSGGRLTAMPWAIAPEPAAAAAPVDSIARLGDEAEDEEDLEDAPAGPEAPPEATAPGDHSPAPVDEAWAPLPTAALQPAPAPPPVEPAARQRREPFSLRVVERKLLALQRTLSAPVVGEGVRALQVRDVQWAADSGDCEHALELADAWLRALPSARPEEPQLKRTVLTQKLRCLNHLGRSAEAAAVQRELEALPPPR